MSKWTLIVDVIPVNKFIKIVCARVKIFFGSKVIRRALNIIDLFIFIIFLIVGILRQLIAYNQVLKHISFLILYILYFNINHTIILMQNKPYTNVLSMFRRIMTNFPTQIHKDNITQVRVNLAVP